MKRDCDNCKYSEVMFCDEPCRSCNPAENWEPKVLTNANKIRAMTDEELAEMFDEYSKRNDVCPKFGAYSCHGNDCRECWLDWLKQEVTDD